MPHSHQMFRDRPKPAAFQFSREPKRCEFLYLIAIHRASFPPAVVAAT